MRLSVTAAAALARRLLLATLFLHEAWSKLTAYPAALAYMQAFGVPGQLLPLAIAHELGCGLLILCGYHHPAAAPPRARSRVAARDWARTGPRPSDPVRLSPPGRRAPPRRLLSRHRRSVS